MHKSIPIIATLLMAMTFNNAYASGSTAWGKITVTYVNGGWTMVKVDGFSDNPDECADVDYYALHPNDPNYKVLHAALLSAHIANRYVRFWVDGCSGQGQSRPHIVSVFVK
jgi:hypothetical protein